jgi:branched-chain amino acid transport system substrate-binding protein
MKTVLRLWALTCFVLVVCVSSRVQAEEVIRIYIDADQTHMSAAGQAIEWGVRAALAGVENMLCGYRVEVVSLNHRGNTRRSRNHIQQFIEDDRAIAMVGGVHSVPVLENLSLINESGVLFLAPWSAAAPITRWQGDENWVFRLSIDDAKAGEFIVNWAQREGYRRPFLLLENTGWGQSNKVNMEKALKAHLVKPVGLEFFDWGVSDHTAKLMVQNAINARADVVLMVANTVECEKIVRALLALGGKKDLAVLSHWGILGGDFLGRIGPHMISQIDLQFIQTDFSNFINQSNSVSRQAFDELIKMNSSLTKPSDLNPVVGFVHAYDLMRIFIAGVHQAGLTGNVVTDRLAIKQALQNLQTKIDGIMMQYDKPFNGLKAQSDAHEALTVAHYRMGRFRPDGSVVLEAGVITE